MASDSHSSASQIRQIKVVSNTHWDREFRRSFEKTRRRLLDMMDVTLGILEKDPAYHSFTLDGHCILVDDYLEMRPEKRPLVERLLREGRLVAGPWYTLAEEFSISSESLVRNFLLGRKTLQKYGATLPTVAYTPSSWGQTGQLPQILMDFGCDKMMFYRGISHHESDAEWVWAAPDGTQVLASRFGMYARYNWYYQVHRPVTTGRTFEKDYQWGEFDECPFRFADGLAGEDLAFDLKRPALLYENSRLKDAIEQMVKREGAHFTTPVFLAMHGHDISVGHPMESRIIADARKLLEGKYEIEHTDLEGFWKAACQYLDRAKLPVLTGERRAYLKKGMWTYLFPATISARTYLKQKDFAATVQLVNYAEPLASLCWVLGSEYPTRYLDRGWQYLLSNHTHDANGGCAPDLVCQDMEYRYRKASDIGEIVTEDAMSFLAANLSPQGQDKDAMQLIVVNPLPFSRDAVVQVDLEIPASFKAKSAKLSHAADGVVPVQAISSEKSGSFVDSIWEVPRILESSRVKFHARLRNLPACGYRVYRIEAQPSEPRPCGAQTLLSGVNVMENEHLVVQVNGNGTINLTCKATGKVFENLNYLSDEGEVGNAWRHGAPTFDRKYQSLGARADVAVVEQGPVSAAISAQYNFAVPVDYADGTRRSDTLVDLPVKVVYRLNQGESFVRVELTVDNRARDHWLRANFPTGLATDVTWADSHFDVISRPIAIPDSTGWVEKAGGTHPLRTFVAMSDSTGGLAVMPRGIYEYEAFEDRSSTLALTLIRACRIKLAVSEEKQTELPDAGVQCPGVQKFEYAIHAHGGDWRQARLLSQAAAYATPVRAGQIGRGQGQLPSETSLISLDSNAVQVTAVKQSEDGKSLMIRLFNATGETQRVTLGFGRTPRAASLCRMDESVVEPLKLQGNSLPLEVQGKKIRTLAVEF